MPRSLSVVVPLLLLAACSSASTSDPVEPIVQPPASVEPAPSAPPAARPEVPGTPATPTDVTAAARAFDDALATAVCERLAACCATGEYASFFARFKDKPYALDAAPPPAQCAAVLGKTLWSLHSKWAQSAGRGRITFEAARGQACVSAMKAATCGGALATALNDDACLGVRGNEVFRKIAPTGSACQDIGDGTYYGECDPKKGFCGTSKTCEAWSQTGEPCQISPTRKFCAPSLSCDNNTATTPGTCSGAPITKKLGEGCIASTGPLEECEDTTYCDFVAGKCVAKKADGASCKSDEECATKHPYTCSPIGSGTCGSNSYCSGVQ